MFESIYCTLQNKDQQISFESMGEEAEEDEAINQPRKMMTFCEWKIVISPKCIAC